VTAPTTPTAAAIIDGTAIAARVRADIAARVTAVRAKGGSVRLDAVLVDSGDSAARVYADNQAKTCAAAGIDYKLHVLLAGSGFDEIAGRILLLSADDTVSAIMLHMPLPAGVDPYRVQRLIAPEKDVEGVNPANIGNIVYGRSSLAPCTGLAVLRMVEEVFGVQEAVTKSQSHEATEKGVEPFPHSPPPQHAARGTPHDVPLLRGKIAVVIGASDVVGKPIAVLLMRQDATVISCNKHTPGLIDLTRLADVLVAAAGHPNLVTPDMVKPGAVVIDVGVNRVMGADGKSKTVGDVSFEAVRRVASHISPVPGGVGPVTVAMLLRNVLEAAERSTLPKQV
jgi:methylenetetrahydrofolate dehydrogenase (NADP+)/methenyltetrahydrofolate cyclohydrolase